MSEERREMAERIPGYLFGALSASEGRNESALVIIKTRVSLNGGHILNPHVASQEENKRMREEYGFRRLKQYDWEQLEKAQFGIGDVSLPSIGVGMEIERLLERRKVPVLALRSSKSDYISVLVEGQDDPNYQLVVYESYEHIDIIVEGFMEKLKGKIHG